MSRKSPEPLDGHVEGRINIGRKSGGRYEHLPFALSASRGQRCPSVIRLPHRDTFSCEPAYLMNRYRKWVFMSAYVISITATSHTAAGKRVLKFRVLASD